MRPDLDGRVRHAAENRKMPAPMSTSPANTHRHEAYVVEPPISGPTAIAIAPAAPTSPYAGSSLGREVPRDERDDGGHDQGRPDALQDRPAEQQHREVRRQGPS